MYTLYDYQKDALRKVLRALEIQMAVLMIMATGLGKTVVAAKFAKREYKRKQRGLFLCHENHILNQAFDDFRQELGPEAVLRKFYGEKKDWNADEADVLFASFQSFKDWHRVFDKNHFDYIVVDESHHGPAPTYKRVIKYFTPKKLLGMSALKQRTDELSIEELFGKPVVEFPLEMGLAMGWLTYVEYHVMNDGINAASLQQMTQEVLEKGKRVSIKQLNENIFVQKRDEEVAEEIRKYNNGEKKTIIFCENIQHAENFSLYLPGSVMFHSGQTADQNNQALQDFRDGKVTEILAVDKFNEGIDVPDVEVIVFLRNTDSLNVFLQQLGRGLRKIAGKEKVIVLDFVANCQRLMYLAEMGGRVNGYLGKGLDLAKEKLSISGDAFDFIFTDLQIDILEILKRLKAEFYPTWQEASAAAIQLGLKSALGYMKGYRVDSMLPSSPHNYYPDFPTWPVFLGKKRSDYYASWQEAGAAAVKAGIASCTQYSKFWSRDVRLPKYPSKFYKDFPGWRKFLGNKDITIYYPTWQEASKAAIALKITSMMTYRTSYPADPRLPSAPHEYYDDFPTWPVFLEKEEFRREFYPTWQEAAEAVKGFGIKNQTEYRKQKPYLIDRKLPSAPEQVYKDFPGWARFTNRRNYHEYYPTWQEASKAAIALGIKTHDEYRKSYTKDPRLPAGPETFYPDCPGNGVFLQTGIVRKNRKNLYPTWQEAAVGAKAAGVTSSTDYKVKHHLDPRLPSSPFTYYKDFPGFVIFLGSGKIIRKRKTKEIYATWQEASKAAIALGIKNYADYYKRYILDPKLPSTPAQYYKDYPGMTRFLDLKYATWQEAGIAAQKLNINTRKEYQQKRHLDSKLPGYPNEVYADFPGYRIFLGKES